mmetsp:Transcript_29025/g.38544  ORF Transcript_29025/g.38544 Transcript_29025/m.38544 type:complete len:205 (-) Transcript_29025:223-837(-)
MEYFVLVSQHGYNAIPLRQSKLPPPACDIARCSAPLCSTPEGILVPGIDMTAEELPVGGHSGTRDGIRVHLVHDPRGEDVSVGSEGVDVGKGGAEGGLLKEAGRLGPGINDAGVRCQNVLVLPPVKRPIINRDLHNACSSRAIARWSINDPCEQTALHLPLPTSVGTRNGFPNVRSSCREGRSPEGKQAQEGRNVAVISRRRGG